MNYELELYMALEESEHGLVFLEICGEFFGPDVKPTDERAAFVTGFLDGLVRFRKVYVSRVPGLPDRYFLAPEGKRFLRQNRVLIVGEPA